MGSKMTTEEYYFSVVLFYKLGMENQARIIIQAGVKRARIKPIQRTRWAWV